MNHYITLHKSQPTEAQIEAGNYKKHHINFQGLDISIENKKGSIRSGTDREGKTWSIKMKSDYGYIKGTKGKDKDHLDVFVGSNKLSEKVFIINQINKAGQFDEHKVMLGYNSIRQAKRKYLENYEKGWKGLGEIKELTMEELKEWLKDGNTMIAKTYTEVDCTHLCPVVELEKADHPNQKHGKGGRYVKTGGVQEIHIESKPEGIDKTTEEHLQKWLENTVDERDRKIVEAGIKRVVSEQPDLVTRGTSWPEIRRMAEVDAKKSQPIKLKWKTGIVPKGRWKSFQKRDWPNANYESGLPAIDIIGEESYNLDRVKTGNHSELTVRVAQYHHTEELKRKHGAFSWRILKQRFTSLNEAKEAGGNFIQRHPEFHPKETEKSQPIYIDISKSKSQLVRKPIVDKTGKRTTVWINPESGGLQKLRKPSKLLQQNKSSDHQIQVGIDASREELFTIAKERGLTIPPAWQDVWVNKDPQGKIQVTGKDTKGRKVYIRSVKYCEEKSAEKFARLKDFTKAFPTLVDKIKKDMKTSPEAQCLYLISQTGFRIGGEGDTKAEKQAYGASTLLGSHVQIKGTELLFDFIGKKGVRIQQAINDPKIVNVIGQRSKNERLFDTNPVQVRDYLHSIDGNFKVKDFRTYMGTTTALKYISMLPKPTNDKELKKAILEVCKAVAAKLGNTPAVAKSAYIAPECWQQWEVA